jgi:hypothetical protein
MALAGLGWRAVPRLVGVLLLCVALTACGKSTEDKYKDGFPPINRTLVVLSDDVGEGLRNADDARLAHQFAGYARRLAGLRERLDGLEAPEPVAKDHEALLGAMATVRGALADVAEAARRGDAAAAGDAAARLVRGATRLDEVRAELAGEARAL